MVETATPPSKSKRSSRVWACTVSLLDGKYWHGYNCKIEAGQPHVAVSRAVARGVRSFRQENGRKKITQVHVQAEALTPVRPEIPA